MDGRPCPVFKQPWEMSLLPSLLVNSPVNSGVTPCPVLCLGLGYSSSPPLLNPEDQASVVHPGMGKEVELFVGLF